MLCRTSHSIYDSSRVAELSVTNRPHCSKVLVIDISTGVNHIQGKKVQWMGVQWGGMAYMKLYVPTCA